MPDFPLARTRNMTDADPLPPADIMKMQDATIAGQHGALVLWLNASDFTQSSGATLTYNPTSGSLDFAGNNSIDIAIPLPTGTRINKVEAYCRRDSSTTLQILLFRHHLAGIDVLASKDLGAGSGEQVITMAEGAVDAGSMPQTIEDTLDNTHGPFVLRFGAANLDNFHAFKVFYDHPAP